jgi:hypothetical protein
MGECRSENTRYSTRESSIAARGEDSTQVSSSEVSLLGQAQPQEAAMFDHYAPRIGPLPMGASFLLVALAVWAIILLAR